MVLGGEKREADKSSAEPSMGKSLQSHCSPRAGLRCRVQMSVPATELSGGMLTRVFSNQSKKCGRTHVRITAVLYFFVIIVCVGVPWDLWGKEGHCF